MSYTNSDGVSGRTATISAFPATCIAGSIIPFLLDTGDNGVQSIQSITLGTTLSSGAFSLIAFRRVITQGCYAGDVDRFSWNDSGVRILSGSTMVPFIIPTVVTTGGIQGTVYFHNTD